MKLGVGLSGPDLNENRNFHQNALWCWLWVPPASVRARLCGFPRSPKNPDALHGKPRTRTRTAHGEHQGATLQEPAAASASLLQER